MADIEKIQEDAVPPIFNELLRDQIPLRIQIADDEDVRLTHIKDIRKRRRTLHFLLKSPPDFQAVVDETKPTHLIFEFFDSENIKYVFETDTWEIARDSLWIKFPKYVHRYQRRKLFRLEAPHGTRLYFKVNDVRYKLLVINVSLGGTLGVLVSLTKQMERELKQYSTKTLENVELLFPSKDRKLAGTIVNIKRCQIKRQEKNPITGKFECAMEFKEISETEQKNLTDLFYEWQREYLRKRKIMRA